LVPPTVLVIVGITNVGSTNVEATEVPMTTTTHPDLDRLADRAEIADLIYRLGACLDDGRFHEMRDLLVANSTVRTPGGQAEGRDALVAQAARNHPEGQGFQHVTTNVLVDVAGDRATARANLVVHVTTPDGTPPTRQAPVPPPVASLGEVYRFELSRTPDGWRFAHIETVPLWLSGSLPPA
jgi:hypothetical protein